MSIKLKHLAVATLAASLSGIAVAGEDTAAHGGAMSKSAPDFSQLDSDNNGTISRSEVRNADSDTHTGKLTEKWSELDTNRDSELDRSEFARFEATTEKKDKAYKSSKDEAHKSSKGEAHKARQDYGTGEEKSNYDAGMESPH